MNGWIIASVALTVFATATLVSVHNRLVGLSNHCDNSFSQIEVQLKRRFDLIPNLVECVKGHMDHERESLERVIAAREQAAKIRQAALQQPKNREIAESWMGAEVTLGCALGGFWMALESYPELKANRSVAELTEQLTSTENRIAFARQAYNDWVSAFNAYRQSFPQCSLAGRFGFKQNRKLLEFANPAEWAAAPSVVLS